MPRPNKTIANNNEHGKNKIYFYFLANNVKVFQSTKKRLCSKDILFLQETLSSVEIEKKWIDDFNEKNCYSLGLYNSFGALSIDSSLR